MGLTLTLHPHPHAHPHPNPDPNPDPDPNPAPSPNPNPGEWQDRTAGAFQAWETDQTAFDDMLRGRGRGHRRSMTPQQRAERLRYKLEWCGLPKATGLGVGSGLRLGLVLTL